ncbi:MAG TPA: hypothetical protein VMY41_02490 [Thermohalobaculum sp.]|nr:hypothetical protein [Thermohalobaculum sp.]
MAELECGKFGSPLKQFHRDAMLDLILVWGTLDGALTMLVAAFTGEPLHEAADRIGKTNGSNKIVEVANIIKNYDDGMAHVKNFRKWKKKYEKYSVPRNRIAHAHCVGYLESDDQYIVFAVAEHEGGGNMAIEAIPVEEMKQATQYGEMLAAFAVNIVERIEAARSRDFRK